MKIGRYEIRFGRYCWIQTRGPTRVWHVLFIWVFKEARPQDVDRKQQFPIGTRMVCPIATGEPTGITKRVKLSERRVVMWIKLTEEAAEILLEEKEVQLLVKGEMVMGAPASSFMSPFGKRLVFVRQQTPQDLEDYVSV